MDALRVLLLALERDVVVGRLVELVEHALLGQQDLLLAVLAADPQRGEQLQEVVPDCRPGDELQSLPFLDAQLLLELLLPPAVLQLLLPALVADRHLAELVVFVLQQHLLLRLLLRKDHVEPLAVEVVAHAVGITAQYLRLHLLLFVLLLVFALNGLSLHLYLRHFTEALRWVVREAADHEVSPLVVVVAQHFLQLLPLFEVAKRDVLRDHASQSIGHESAAHHALASHLRQVLNQSLCEDQSPPLVGVR